MSDNGEVIVSITYDARASAQAAVDASNKVVNSLEAVNKSVSGVARTVAGLAKQFDPVGIALQKLTAQYDSIRAAQEKLGKPNSFSAEQEASIRQGITLLPQLRQKIEELQTSYIRAASGQDKLNIEIERQNNLLAKSAAITQQVQIDQYNKKLEDSARATKAAADRFDYLQNKYGQVSTAGMNYTKTTNELNEALNKGAIGYRDYSNGVSRAIDVHNKASTAGQQNIKTQKDIKENVDRMTIAFGLNRIGMMELQAAGVNTFQALASGMSPMRVATMEGSQVMGAFIQGTTYGFTGILKAIASPIGAVVTGLTLFSVGLGVVIAKAIEGHSAIRQFDILLRGFGATSLESAKGLEEVSKRLKDVGLSASDARVKINAVIQAGLNPGMAERIIRTGENLTSFLGPNAAQTLNTALSGGVESALKLALHLHADLTPELIATWREMSRVGLASEAITQIFGKIEEHTKGLNQAALTPLGKALRDLNIAFTQLLDTMSKSTAIQKMVDGLTKMLDLVKSLFELKPPAWLSGFMGSMIPGVGAIGGILGGKALNSDSGIVASAAIPGAVGSGTGPGGIPLSPAAIELQTLVAKIIQIESAGNPRAVSSAGAQGLMQLMPGTASELGVTNPFDIGQNVSGGTRYIQSLIQKYGDVQTALMAYNWGPGNVDKYLAGQKSLPNSVANYPTSVLSATPNQASLKFAQGAVGELGNIGVLRPDRGIANASEIDNITKEWQRQLEVLKRVGAESEALKAIQDAEATAKEKLLNPLETERLKREAIANVYAKVSAEQDKTVKITELEISQTKDLAIALEGGAFSGLKAEEASRAQIETYQKLGTVTGDLALKTASLRAQQFLVQEQFNLRVKFNQQNIQDQNQIQFNQIQVQLEGKTTEEIQTQVALRKVILDAEAVGLDLSDKTVQNRIKETIALGQSNAALAEANRQQQRLENLISSVANTITGSLTTSITELFNGTKVTDWGTKIKTMLGQITAQITEMAFIKPAIGSVLGGLGLTNLSSQFGSLGNLFGSGSSSSSGVTLTDSSGNKFTLSNAGNALGVGKSLFGDSAGSGGGFFNNIASSLGFNTGNVVNGTGAGAGIFTDLTTGVTSDVGSVGGLFGSTTLGGFASGVGAGFGAGSLLNSLLGGDPMGGTIGSGVGSLAGAAIGSIVPGIGTLIGGLIGGAGGGLLGGLFGSTVKPDNTAQGVLNLATGGMIKSVSGPDATNNATVQQINQSISSFTQIANRLGTISGQIQVQAGSREGIRLSFNSPGTEWSEKASDATDAIQKVEASILRNLSVTSTTLRTILDQNIDPADLEKVAKFADTYDKLTSAFDKGFSTLQQDAETVGPFETALESLKTTFQDLTDTADKYGISLDPILAGQKKATEELNASFKLSLDSALSGMDFLNTLTAAHKTFVENTNDAAALGVSGVSTQIQQIEEMKIAIATSGASLSDLQKAQKSIADTAPEISNFISTLISAGQYLPDQITQLIQAITNPVGLAIEKEKLAGQQRVRVAEVTGQNLVDIARYNELSLETIWKQATSSLTSLQTELKTGNLSGLNPMQQLSAARTLYNTELNLVKGGNTAEFGNLSSAGQNLASLFQTDFGNSKQTANVRAEILRDLDSILSKKGFATGSSYMPKGWVLVGEQGPEWMNNVEGNSIFPSGTKPYGSDNTELISEMRMLRQAIDNGNNINRTVGVETIDRLDQVVAVGNRKPVQQLDRQRV